MWFAKDHVFSNRAAEAGRGPGQVWARQAGSYVCLPHALGDITTSESATVRSKLGQLGKVLRQVMLMCQAVSRACLDSLEEV